MCVDSDGSILYFRAKSIDSAKLHNVVGFFSHKGLYRFGTRPHYNSGVPHSLPQVPLRGAANSWEEEDDREE